MSSNSMNHGLMKSAQKKVAKLQQLKNPSQINGDNVNTVRFATSKTFRNKEMEYLKV
jgi:hypothetical protein